MANSQTTGPRHEYATVDTAPGASGYWCNTVSMSNHKTLELFFSRRGGGVGTVHVQFKTGESGAEWTDYVGDIDFDDGVRCIVEDHGAGIRWRAGVKENNYTSGDIIFGFDW